MSTKKPNPVKIRNALAVINCLTFCFEKDIGREVERILKEVKKLEDHS